MNQFLEQEVQLEQTQNTNKDKISWTWTLVENVENVALIVSILIVAPTTTISSITIELIVKKRGRGPKILFSIFRDQK